MSHIVTTIIPIFSLVIIGTIAQSKGFLPLPPHLGPANRLVYCPAIPAMLFRAIASSAHQFNPTVIWLSLVAVVVFGIGWACNRLLRLSASIRGAFIQRSFHGNLGYIGLAVAFYHPGPDGLARVGILASFFPWPVLPCRW